jgi:hypothetical protein
MLMVGVVEADLRGGSLSSRPGVLGHVGAVGGLPGGGRFRVRWGERVGLRARRARCRACGVRMGFP